MKTDLINEKGRALKSRFEELRRLDPVILEELNNRCLSGRLDPKKTADWLKQQGVDIQETIIWLHAKDVLEKAKASIGVYEKRLKETDKMSLERARQAVADIGLFKASEFAKREAWQFREDLKDREELLNATIKRLESEPPKTPITATDKIRADLLNGLSVTGEQAKQQHGIANLDSIIQALKKIGWPIQVERQNRKASYSLPVGWKPDGT